MAKKKQVPELKVLFDTNALFTQMASDLVKPDVVALIADHSAYPDHKISWFIPAIVRHERQYQMVKAAMQLLPSLTKLEKLLGHNLAITESILKQRVAETIERQLIELSLSVVELDPGKIDWNRLMLDAVYRRPPFDPGEKEKGFRDALIVESLGQLIAQSSVTPTVCRIVLVTNDGLLKEASERATSSRQNVRIVADLDELKGLINTLVSQVGEDFIAEVQPKANSYFFLKDDRTTLYFRGEVGKQIKERYVSELSLKPPGVTETDDGTWYVGNPRFVKKEGQRVFWASRIEPTFKGFRTEAKPYVANTGLMAASADPSAGPLSKLAGLLASTTPERVLVGEFGHVFEVEWSVTLGQHKKLTTGKIEDIRFVETRLRNGTN